MDEASRRDDQDFCVYRCVGGNEYVVVCRQGPALQPICCPMPAPLQGDTVAGVCANLRRQADIIEKAGQHLREARALMQGEGSGVSA